MLIHLLLSTILLEAIVGLTVIVDIPKHIMIGKVAEFKCIYELGETELYAVKWYKDRDEFYRYVPKDNPPGQVFNMSGILVNLTLSNDTMLVLENVQLSTSGLYKCEVSEEAPSFRTESQTREMMVMDPPSEEKPVIIGDRPKYSVGDLVHVNCSAPKSSPPATLEWTVNGKKVDEPFLLDYAPTEYSDGKASSTLGLKFQVMGHHFQNGVMTLKCMARVEPFYYQSNQKSIVGDHITASVLESKEGYVEVQPSNSATRLHGLFGSLWALVVQALPVGSSIFSLPLMR